MSSSWRAISQRLAMTTTMCIVMAAAAPAQTPPASADDSALRAAQAIKARKAVYTLIGSNFGSIAAMLQGKVPFDGDDALKRAERIGFLAGLALEAYPDISKNGDTKAKPEIWENRRAFDKRTQDLIDHSSALAAVLRKDKTNADAFKTAATPIAADCKGCHDEFRAK